MGNIDGSPLDATAEDLELDELLDAERAGGDRSAEGRLRGLLAATRHVAADLDLDEVLSRLVDAGRELVGSRWAALGLLHGGRMTQVVHRRGDAPLVEMLHRLPTDTGVLGWAVDDPRSVRIDDLAAHPDAIHQARTHRPAIRSFLRAPVRAGTSTYGNLYLADARAGIFTDGDRQLVVALAAAAGAAVRNAVLLTRAHRQHRWSQAGSDLAMRLLAPDAEPAEGRTALLELAVDAAEADSAMLTVLDPAVPDTVEVVAAVGELAQWQGCRVTAAVPMTRAVLEGAGPMVVRDPTADPCTTGLVAMAPGVATVLATSIPQLDDHAGEPAAVLTLTRTADRESFRDLEIDMVHAFAVQAATTLALARARQGRDRLLRLEDREQALRGLQHTVISQLQRSTLTIANVAGRVDPRLQTMLLDQVDALDRLVRTMRDTMFDVPP